MRVLFFGVIFVIIFSNSLFAQDEVERCSELSKSHDYEKAVGACEKAVRLDPGNLNAHFYLGDAYQHVGRFNPALSEMDRAEKLATSRRDTMRILGKFAQIYHHLGFHELSSLSTERYLALAKELDDLDDRAMKVKAFIDIAGIYSEAGELGMALKVYEEALPIAINRREAAEIYVNVENTYRKMGDFEKAALSLKKAIAMAEKDGDCLAVDTSGEGRPVDRNADAWRQTKKYIP